MQQGWIKLDRSVLEHWLHEDKPFNRFAAWVDLLLMANFEDKKVMVAGDFVFLERGQIATSIRFLSSRWGWSKDKVSYFLNVLESDGMITKKCDSNRTVLTLVNYRDYQDIPDSKKTVAGHESDADRTLVGQLSDTHRTLIGQNKERKNKKNEKNEEQINNITNIPLNPPRGGKDIRYFPNDERLEETFQAFLVARNKLKKNSNTEYAIKLLLSKLQKLSTDPDIQVKILEQSIERGWIGIFELQGGKKVTTTESLAEKWGL